jgi:hypothetical protein
MFSAMVGLQSAALFVLGLCLFGWFNVRFGATFLSRNLFVAVFIAPFLEEAFIFQYPCFGLTQWLWLLCHVPGAVDVFDLAGPVTFLFIRMILRAVGGRKNPWLLLIAHAVFNSVMFSYSIVLETFIVSFIDSIVHFGDMPMHGSSPAGFSSVCHHPSVAWWLSWLQPHCSHIHHPGFASAPIATALMAMMYWCLARLGSRAAKVHRAFCCGGCKLRRQAGLKCRVHHHRCRQSQFMQIGPDLPFHYPLLMNPCTHVATFGLSQRMLAPASGYEEGFSPDLSFLKDPKYGIDATPLVWDWDHFIEGKPARLRDRAIAGLASLKAKGAYVDNGQLHVPWDHPKSKHDRVQVIDQIVGMFTKREFYDYWPNEDKVMKPRIISGCSDEVLAWLGPYMLGLCHKVGKLYGMYKDYSANVLSHQCAAIVQAARSWHKRVVAYDVHSYDRNQGPEVLNLQHQLYQMLGMPYHVLQFLAEYDLEWVGEFSDRELHRRAISFHSTVGCRKSGDPHTSAGNNLFHWFLVMYLSHIWKSDVVCMINGDDFLGAFERVNFSDLVALYQRFGITVERGEGYEFCGGYYMGEQYTYVRDPTRALFKFGWFHGNIHLDPVSVMHAVSQCHSYISSQNPILSSLIRRCYALSCGSLAYQHLTASQIGYAASFYLGQTGLSPTFSTSIPFDVRIEYYDRFGIPPCLQIEQEVSIQHLNLSDSLLPLVGRLLF